MHTASIVLAAVLATAGCSPARPAVAPGPPARQVEVGRLPDQPLHDTHPAPSAAGRLRPGSEVDRADPAAVATARIAGGLADQGLQALDVAATTTSVATGRASVRVRATHQAGPADVPYTSVYVLELARSPAGGWTVTRAEAVG